MPILTKTYSFDSSSEGWTFISSNMTGSRITSDGMTGAGCLQGNFIAPDVDYVGSCAWKLGEVSWESLGVPSGRVVTSVNASFRYKITNSSGNISFGLIGPLLIRGAYDTVLEQEAEAYEGEWGIRNSTGYATIPYEDSASSAVFDLRLSGGFVSDSGGCNANLLIDEISLDILYSDPVTISKSVGGSLTPVGTLSKSFSLDKILYGYITPIGDVARYVLRQKVLGGVLSFAGSVSTVFGAITKTKLVSGAINMSGSLGRTIGKTLSGAMRPTGLLNRSLTKIKLLYGEITFMGVLPGISDTVSKALSGSISFAGSLFRNKIVTLIVKTLVGSISPTGSLSKISRFSKMLSGSIAFTGTLGVLKTAYKFVGSISFVGSLSMTIYRSVGTIIRFLDRISSRGSSLGMSGAISMVIGKAYSGVLTSIGRLSMIIHKQQGGSINMSGSLDMKVTKYVNLSGEIGMSGSTTSVKKDLMPERVVKFWNKIIRLRR